MPAVSLKTPQAIDFALGQNLLRVEKPGRYVGGEFNAIRKDWSAVDLKVALCFPEVYEIGMPNLGLAIFYEILNTQPDMLAERVYLPWIDMESIMRAGGIPLYSLETRHPVSEFDILAITIPYEQLYTNVLQVLSLSDLPLRSRDRDSSLPLVIAGGHACTNPEPMADFIDAFVIGEGEEVILEIASRFHQLKQRGLSREDQLIELAKIDGVYVPRFYRPVYNGDGTINQVEPINPHLPFPVMKRIVSVLPPPPTRLVVPNIDTVHNRVPVEIMRGCTRGCRFCHAGMTTRPVRERPVDDIVNAIEQAIGSTGYEEVALLSLSSSDYTHIVELVDAISAHYSDRHLSISLPSLRIESSSVDLLEALKDSKRGGFTFAPEAATESMLNTINKVIPSQQLLDVAYEVYRRGWRTIKLYFMIGHPSETLDDVRAIVDLSKSIQAEGRKVHGKKASVNVSVGTFIPKPHTPFQWVAMDTVEQITEKQDLLKRELRGGGLRLRWNHPEETMLEGLLSRGDRRLGPVIARAWELGCRFDAWQEHYDHAAWMQALEENNLDLDFYTFRPRPVDEVFPWDHIDVGVSKRFLLRDFQMSQRGETRGDCRDQCYACGILSKYGVRLKPEPGTWKCPPV